MGRYDFSPQRVHQTATQLLSHKRLTSPPPWYNTISAIPPSERLTRPPLQRSQKPSKKKASRLFKPLRLQFEEERLRWEFFNDHPWELARPKVILENDGRDAEKWDWSVPLDHALKRPPGGERDREGRALDVVWDEQRRAQSGRRIDGEAVIRRQHHLLHTSGHSPASAYDTARKEFYRHRHYTETEVAVAREEALSTGAYFGKGALEVGMELEDAQFDKWAEWAVKESEAARQLAGSAYTGQEAQETALTDGGVGELQEVSGSVPASKKGQEARGGAAAHP